MKYLIRTFFIVFILILLTPKLVSAEAQPIKVSGYDLTRSRSPLLDSSGNPLVHPAGSNTGSTVLGGFLKNSANFGSEGVVECPVEFKIPSSYISSGTLVGEDGNLLLDVFFATATSQDLASEEIAELKKFVNAGGILYVQTGTTDGTRYNEFLIELGINLVFNEYQDEVSSIELTSDPTDNFPTTSGPFGDIGPLKHSKFWSINSTDSNIIALNPNNGKAVLVDTPIGNGYLSVSGTPLHVNILASVDNQKYFGNLISLACNRSIPKVLDVPSYKQRFTPWENDIYDASTMQPMWCGTTIGQCGCAMTSTAMAMAYKGLTKMPDGTDLTPLSLDNYFSLEPTPIPHKKPDGTEFNTYRSNGYNWGDFAFDWVDDFSLLVHNALPDQPKLEQGVIEQYNLEKIKQLIDSGTPVVLKVLTPANSWHWVLVKGYKENELIINDPYYPDPQSGQYETLTSRGYTIPTDIKKTRMVHYNTTQSDFSSLVLKVSAPTELLITDKDGRRTGYTSSGTVEEIPNSTYYLSEPYSPPDSEIVPPEGVGVNTLYITTPEDGEYTIEVTSSAGTPDIYTLFASTVAGESKIYDLSHGMEIIYSNSNADLPIMLDADIDIMPFVKRNIVVPWSFGLIPVGIFSNESINARDIDESSLGFGRTGEEKSLSFCLNLDLNKDKLKDKYCVFRTIKTGLKKGDTSAYLVGETKEGLPFKASDSVEVVGGRMW